MSIECSDVHYAYKLDMEREVVLETARPALLGASLSLPRGCRAVLIGANGAGKSTLLRAIGGRLRPDAGEARCLGIEAQSPQLNGRVAFVDAQGWFKHQKTLASLNVGSMVDAKPNASLERALRLSRLRQYETRGLSDGELRRVQLFATLAQSPEVVLLDEACVELDAVVRAAFLDYIRAQGQTCLYATHVLDGLDDWATHVVFVKDGRVARATTAGASLYDEARAFLGAAEATTACAQSDDVVVSADQVTWSYDRRPALLDFAVTVRRGARVVLVGANGSGKSSCLRLFAGARLAPNAALEVLGQHPSIANLRAKNDVVLLGGAFRAALDDLLPVSSRVPFSELLASALRHSPVDDKAELAARAQRLVSVLDIDPTWTPATASEGSLTRMQLAIQLAAPAKVYLVDEITRHLDLVARARLLDWFNTQPDATVLFATHIFQGLDGWATHLAHVRHGRLVRYVESPAALYPAILAWLQEDDGLNDDRPPREDANGHVAQASASAALPAGWTDRRPNTLEASFGGHAWTAQACHGRFGENYSAHQTFESLYLATARGHQQRS